MNLKRLFVAEIVIIIVVVITVVVFVEITPYLATTSQNSQIGVFNQREYAKETVTLQRGQVERVRFNYTTYDPAILVVELKFEDWQKPGSLSMYCNGVIVTTFDATPSNPSFKSTTVSFSGFDLIKPPPSKLSMSSQFTYGNEISFSSSVETGYEGTFNYQISIRGSR